MNEARPKAIDELILEAQIAVLMLRGVWFASPRHSAMEALLEQVMDRLTSAAEAAKEAGAAQGEEPAHLH